MQPTTPFCVFVYEPDFEYVPFAQALHAVEGSES